MRSRYTAYVMGNEGYLLNSWHASSRPASIEFDPQQRWLGLKLTHAQDSGGPGREAVVEFVARFKIAGRAYRLHEISHFEHGSEGWVYTGGTRGSTDSSQRE